MNQEEVKTKVIREEKFKTHLPTMIKIGDPSYFGEYDHLTYNKRFRGKNDWKGIVVLKEVVDIYEDMEIESLNYDIYFAPTQEYVDTYMEGMKYNVQKAKSYEIGVDTAEYLLETTNFYENVDTMGDGYWGEVIELKTGNSLTGIIIHLTVPKETYGFDEFMKILKLLFLEKQQ